MTNYWILTGSLENWDVAISNSIWGVKKILKPKWDNLKIGDILFFYVTTPISGIMGVGKVTNKVEGKNQLWVEEIKNNKIIYHYRFEFQTIYTIQKPWKKRKISIGGLRVGFWAGLNPINNLEAVEELAARIKRFWGVDLEKPIEKRGVVKEKKITLHDEIKNKLKEIGEMKNFISESEYQISESDRRFLDVVWRPRGVGGAVPKYIFEIEDKGGFYRALAKLKHCLDLWGFPKLFIIVKKEDTQKVYHFLDGTFHEIKENLKILDVEKINEMYEAEKKSFEAKQNTGLP